MMNTQILAGAWQVDEKEKKNSMESWKNKVTKKY